jgi:hypothetical protein
VAAYRHLHLRALRRGQSSALLTDARRALHRARSLRCYRLV